MTSNFFVAGAAAMTSNKDDWETPQALFDSLDRQYRFTLDPASNGRNAKCARFCTPANSGLDMSWGGERVFLNPPYGRGIGAWVEKAHLESKRAEAIVMLVPARTDTSWFHDHIYHVARIEFLRGRLKFEQNGVPGQSAPFPSMLVFYE